MRWASCSSPSYGSAGEKTVAWAGEELAVDGGSPDGNAGPCRHEMFILRNNVAWHYETG